MIEEQMCFRGLEDESGGRSRQDHETQGEKHSAPRDPNQPEFVFEATHVDYGLNLG